MPVYYTFYKRMKWRFARGPMNWAQARSIRPHVHSPCIYARMRAQVIMVGDDGRWQLAFTQRKRQHNRMVKGFFMFCVDYRKNIDPANKPIVSLIIAFVFYIPRAYHTGHVESYHISVNSHIAPYSWCFIASTNLTEFNSIERMALHKVIWNNNSDANDIKSLRWYTIRDQMIW